MSRSLDKPRVNREGFRQSKFFMSGHFALKPWMLPPSGPSVGIARLNYYEITKSTSPLQAAAAVSESATIRQMVALSERTAMSASHHC